MGNVGSYKNHMQKSTTTKKTTIVFVSGGSVFLFQRVMNVTGRRHLTIDEWSPKQKKTKEENGRVYNRKDQQARIAVKKAFSFIIRVDFFS
jgi:hypothetical protein